MLSGVAPTVAPLLPGQRTMPNTARGGTPPPAQTMSILAASKRLGLHRHSVKDRIARGELAAELDDNGHLRPTRASVERLAAQLDAERAAAAPPEAIPA